ncbi:hypothetical protein GCM10027436_26980 [Actinophytocola sediminis]
MGSGTAAAAQLTPATLTESQAEVIAQQSCDAGFVCFWSAAYYGGVRGQLAGNNANWSAFPRPECGAISNYTWNDCASSAFNNGTQCTAYLYRAGGYVDLGVILPRGTGVNYFNQANNDAVSSNDWC